MFVREGVRPLLLQGERDRFLTDEWPRVSGTIERLGLSVEELQRAAVKNGKGNERLEGAQGR